MNRSDEIRNCILDFQNKEFTIYTYGKWLLNELYPQMDIHEWNNSEINYDDKNDTLHIVYERFICGESDYQSITIPLKYFDIKDEDVIALEKGKIEEEKRLAKERVEAMKKQMEEETLIGERRLYESLKRKFENE